MMTSTVDILATVVDADSLQGELEALTTELIRDPTSDQLTKFRDAIELRYNALMARISPKLPAEVKEIAEMKAKAHK